MRIVATLVLSAWLSTSSATLCGDKEWSEHPALCGFLQRASDDDLLADDLHDWAARQGLLVDLREQQQRDPPRLQSSGNNYPVVFAHGMGDSCFNSGMQHITNHTAVMLGTYGTCIATGDSQASDTKNGYFLNMDASVDVFAKKVRADAQLQGGFVAIGFSQGNNIIRGYLAKYNDPPVRTFLSVNGVNAGIGAVPYCRPSLAKDDQRRRLMDLDMCELLMEQASRSAYTEFAQEHSFQANYWRDPRPSAQERYRQYCQLAVYNNEGLVNETLRENWAKTQRFVWVMATEDGMVFPKEGEHWGAPDPQDPFHEVLPMQETEWYQQDLFGLRAADEAGKNIFESFVGDHLQFTMDDFERWVKTYLVD